MDFPEEYIDDINKAIKILKKFGSTEIFIFGSLIEKDSIRKNFDIDIAVRGIPKNKFFEIYGKLLVTLEHSVDIVCLDYNTPFTELLLKEGNLRRVA